jgi:hypothetical protein
VQCNRNVLHRREGIFQRRSRLRAKLPKGSGGRYRRRSHPTDVRDSEFVIAGLIYAVTADFDIGYKKALSPIEVDRALPAGLTFRF